MGIFREMWDWVLHADLSCVYNGSMTYTTETTTKNTYEITLPDGQIVTKTSTRTYTHAVCMIVDSEWEDRQLQREIDCCENEIAKNEHPEYNERNREIIEQCRAKQGKVYGWCVRTMSGSLENAQKQANSLSNEERIAEVRIIAL